VKTAKAIAQRIAMGCFMNCLIFIVRETRLLYDSALFDAGQRAPTAPGRGKKPPWRNSIALSLVQYASFCTKTSAFLSFGLRVCGVIYITVKVSDLICRIFKM
jgi:hypothetical protein